MLRGPRLRGNRNPRDAERLTDDVARRYPPESADRHWAEMLSSSSRTTWACDLTLSPSNSAPNAVIGPRAVGGGLRLRLGRVRLRLRLLRFGLGLVRRVLRLVDVLLGGVGLRIRLVGGLLGLLELLLGGGEILVGRAEVVRQVVGEVLRRLMPCSRC